MFQIRKHRGMAQLRFTLPQPKWQAWDGSFRGIDVPGAWTSRSTCVGALFGREQSLGGSKRNASPNHSGRCVTISRPLPSLLAGEAVWVARSANIAKEFLGRAIRVEDSVRP